MRATAGSVRPYVLLAIVAAVLAAAGAVPAGGKAAKSSRLAKYTSLCKITDPKINECMRTFLGNILKYAKTGIPELKIPAIDPLVLPELDLRVFEGLASALGAGSLRGEKSKAVARNLIVHRSSEFELNDLKVDMQKREFFIDLSFPRLEVEGEYDVNLMMFGMPLKSVGPVFVNATDIDAKATVSGVTMKRKGNTYLLFNSINIKVDFKDYSIKIDKLFKKDQAMNRALNDVIKSQKAELRKLALPMIEEMAGKMVLNMVNQILTDLPMEEIFLADH